MFSVVPCATRVVIPNGTPVQGTLLITLSEPMEDTSTGEIVGNVPITCTFDATGSITVNLIAVDDSTTITASTHQAYYTVVSDIVGQAPNTYYIKPLAADAGVTTEMTALQYIPS